MPRRIPQLAKLTRPRLHGAVARERLFNLLDDASANMAAIWVVGPPGAGKTTLVSSYLAVRRIPGIWYQIDTGDADIASFFHYLGMAALPFTRKGKKPLSSLKPEYLADVRGFARRFFRDLFARLPDGSALVFDDYQELPADESIHSFLADAINEVPPGISVIVVSRRTLPECFARLAANERAATIGTETLRLDLEEAHAVAALRVGAATSDIKQIYDMSGGWTAGFILMLEQIRQGGNLAAIDQNESRRAVFDYFAGQLFDRAAALTQRLLLRLSYLPQISATAAKELTGTVESFSLLEDMHRRHLFTTRLQTGEATFQFHALLRAFLQDRARRVLQLPEQQELTLKAAQILEEFGQPESAVPLYFNVGDLQAVRGLVLRQAAHLIGQGRWRLLVQWTELLPREQVQNDCWLMHWIGTATIPAQPSSAREKLEKSFSLAVQCGDTLCQLQAAAGIIETYMVEYTRFRPLDEWIAVIESRMVEGYTFAEPNAELRVQSAVLIGLTFRQPHNLRLASCAARVFDLLESDADINLRATAATHLLRYGSTAGPMELGKRALRHLESLVESQDVTPLIAAFGLAAMTWFYCLTRDREACLKAVTRVDRIAQDEGFPFLNKVSLINRMWLELFAFDLTEAKKWLERLDSVINRAHPFDLATVYGAKAWIALFEDKVDLGLEYESQAVEAFDKAGSTMHRINFRMGLVIGYFKSRRFDLAQRCIEQMREIAGSGITAWQRCSVLMWEANIALELGDRKTMGDRLNAAFTVAQTDGGDFMFFNWGRPWMPRLCHEALSANIEPRYVRDLIRRDRLPPPSKLSPRWPWPVRIYMLGRFALHRDDEPVHFGRKAPRRVLSVLKYIAANGGDGIALGPLADALWGDQEGDSGRKALGVALARLRKLLGGYPLVRVTDERVSINQEMLWTDVGAFEDLVAELDSGSRLCDGPDLADNAASLLSLYRGDLLPCDRDEPWALRPRLRLRAQFIRCLGSLGVRLEAIGHWDLGVCAAEEN